MIDDTGIAIRVGNKAVVVAGCSHSGIQNIARKARKITNVEELIVIGGFHLVSSEEETLKRIVEELASEGVAGVHAGHCTGLKGEAELLKKYRDRMHKIHSGYEIEIKTV